MGNKHQISKKASSLEHIIQKNTFTSKTNVFFTSIFSRFGYIDSKNMVSFGIIFPKVLSEILFADSDSGVLGLLFFPNSFRKDLKWWFFPGEKLRKVGNFDH